MKPKNIHDALRHLHNHTMCIANDIDAYLDSPGEYSPEYFEGIKDAALDAHMLVTWIKDNLKGGNAMRHFKYTAPINPWGKYQRQTIQSAFQQWLVPHRMPTKCNGTADMRYERELAKYNAKRNRDAVGLVRAFGSPTWFKGCYPGAEND